MKVFVLMGGGIGRDTFYGVFDTRADAMKALDRLDQPHGEKPFLMETEFNTVIPHWQREKDWLKV